LKRVDPAFRSNLLLMLGRYKNGIDNVSVQVRLIQIRDYVVGIYPFLGHLLFNEALIEIFPDHAQDIIFNIGKMDQYEHWLLENSRRLSELTEIANDRELWKKRTDLFGTDAQRIWTGNLTAYEQRKHDAREAIKSIEHSNVISNAEKLHQLKESLADLYDHTIEGYAVNKGLVSGLYFAMDSVQQELSERSLSERQQLLNSIRRQIGYSENRILALEKRDQERNRRWENGWAYMKEREKLAESLSGVELEIQLDVHRQKYFKHEARTIALEEESEFYRYLRPRVIGKN